MDYLIPFLEFSEEQNCFVFLLVPVPTSLLRNMAFFLFAPTPSGSSGSFFPYAAFYLFFALGLA